MDDSECKAGGSSSCSTGVDEMEIRKLVPAECWKHCPGIDNLADLPSRGMDCLELKGNTLWWNGPTWLTSSEGPDTANELNEELLPEECL